MAPSQPVSAPTTVRIEHLLDSVTKPAQYLAGEHNSRRKDWDSAQTRLALCFPDAYEIGMSNLAMGLLYELVNDDTPHLCDRCFTPLPDMADTMRAHDIPLFGWESRRPLRDFHILGFSMSYESGNTNVLEMLDLAGIPIERVDRSDHDPIVLGGGSAVSNPEPMADFFDLIAVGEGEDLLQQVLNLHAEFDRSQPGWRDAFIAACARTIPGMYAPGLYEPQYAEDGAFLGHQRLRDDLPERIKRQYVDIDVYSGPRRPVVPNTGVVHDRIAVELDRGCARACRFCQAGYLYRPVRHRSKDLVKNAVDRCLTATGQSEVSLLSLNAVDYKGLDGVITDVYDSAEEYVRVSIPSTRVETFNVTWPTRCNAAASAAAASPSRPKRPPRVCAGSSTRKSRTRTCWKPATWPSSAASAPSSSIS